MSFIFIFAYFTVGTLACFVFLFPWISGIVAVPTCFPLRLLRIVSWFLVVGLRDGSLRVSHFLWLMLTVVEGQILVVTSPYVENDAFQNGWL